LSILAWTGSDLRSGKDPRGNSSILNGHAHRLEERDLGIRYAARLQPGGNFPDLGID